MRCVVASERGDFALPGRELVESVRHLGRRFPQARLRDVPVLRAAELDARADPTGATRVWLALEALQVTGSFKVRGALMALGAGDVRGQIVTASAGNHGAAVAYAASVLGVGATVYIPRTAPSAKRDKIRKYGGELVVVASDHYDDAEIAAKAAAAAQGRVYVSPYDDVNIVLGNGTSLGLEIVRALGGVPERVLAPFGGGGLATGLAWAMAAEGSGASPAAPLVWGVQSEASCAMAMSLERGSAVERLATGEPTIAEGLEGGISTGAFERARAAMAGVLVVEEEQIAGALAYAYREMGLVIEGSAAASLAPVLAGLPRRVCGGDVVVVLTGRNIDRDRLERVLESTVSAA